MSDSLTLQPVAVIHTPYKEKIFDTASTQFGPGWHRHC